MPRRQSSRSAENCSALERHGAQLRGRPAKERFDEEEFVEVELTLPARGRQPGLDLERRAAAWRQRPFRGDPSAGDEERSHAAGVFGRDEHAALEAPHTVEALQLATDPLESRRPVAEPASVFEPPCVRQLAHATPQSRQRRLRPVQLVRQERPRRELRGAARPQWADR